MQDPTEYTRADAIADQLVEERDEALTEVQDALWLDKACWHFFEGIGGWGDAIAAKPSFKTTDTGLLYRVMQVLHDEEPYGVPFAGKTALAIVMWHMANEENPGNDWEPTEEIEAIQRAERIARAEFDARRKAMELETLQEAQARVDAAMKGKLS